MPTDHATEVAGGDRFAFGENWRRFLASMDDDRIATAEDSLRTMLKAESLTGRRFLDVGAGSGLFSLAARRLGAEVRSFDYDPAAVACCNELKGRYFPSDEDWTIGEGSALDEPFMSSLGEHDVVYAWGSLHHTGDMWRAIELTARRVRPGGQLFIAIYNDEGWMSDGWRLVKHTYNVLPTWLRWSVLGPSFAVLWGPSMLRAMLHGRSPLEAWRRKRPRGMTAGNDLVDWVGGYPYEVSTVPLLVDRLKVMGLEPETIAAVKPTRLWKGHGCNQLVLRRGNR
jgi:SAM-dependent methyltransferase